jgi:hypothetical protein
VEALERGAEEATGNLTPRRSRHRWPREGRRRRDGGSGIDLEGPTCGTHQDEVDTDALDGGDEGGFHGSGSSPPLDCRPR